jgi:hypothetical protein
MIPSTKSQLLVAEDWTKIYQSFRNADFQSYDFDTLRRTMITYLRETYPEEFNDYIDSSEYIALIDLIAYLGQNLSFRIDLNARENFLETAQRKDSVLRLAQLISYNPKRNVPANGMLKISALSTTEDVIDANGFNLSNQIIGWNDPTNTNWYQQFISVMNSTMPGSGAFGQPNDQAVISGITTDLYQINSQGSDLPIYTINKAINGVPMTFEITGATFSEKDYIYEVPPVPGGALGVIFQNDNQGAGSINSGFFVHFRQGTMASSGFTVSNPVPNEIIGINANGINNTDVWLWQIGASGTYDSLWTKVDALVGNNVIYNNLSNNLRKFYSVSSRSNDQIDLAFADGSFGDLPKGNFRLFYRQSNGQTYSITPDQLSGINIIIPYANKAGNIHQLTLTLSLQYTVNNSSGPESIASIKQKAPQTYYLQNRMITAEDYNIGPLTAGNNVLKVTSVNRISSGISKYFELSDVSGKYSSTDIYAHDGALYKENKLPNFDFKFQSRNQVFAAVKNQLAPIVALNSFKNFYFENYPRPLFNALNYSWNRVSKKSDQTTGYFQNALLEPVQTGYFSSTTAAYITAGALIKFIAPVDKFFDQNNVLRNTPLTGIPEDGKTYIWSKVIQVIGDGSNQLTGALNDGTGPVILSGKVPSEAIPETIIPAFVTVFSYALETQMVNLCMAQRNFGLSFDKTTRQWFIITDSNLDTVSKFNLTFQGDTTNIQKDSSWLIAFEWTGEAYKVTYRLLEYIFESDKQTAFFVDYSNTNYDFTTNTVIKDQINVLGINKKPSASAELGADYRWQIDSSIVESDGYIEPKKVVVSFYDANNDGQIDNPDSFQEIVDPNAERNGYLKNFVYFKISNDGNRYDIVDTGLTTIEAYPTESAVVDKDVNVLYYFYELDVVKNYDAVTDTFVLNTQYFARSGRSKIKFHYIHNSGEERRIDPSKSNIIDIYVLTSEYDIAFRNWLRSGSGPSPLAPTSQSLENNFAAALEPIKSISDTLVFHPASYKILFGTQATPNLQGTFKAVRNPARTNSDNDLITKIVTAINQFFSLDNWEFGQSFNFTELSTYVLNQMTPDIVNFIIVPKNPSLPFGSLFEIACQSTEILINGATADDIEIIDSLTASELNVASPIINNTNASV